MLIAKPCHTSKEIADFINTYGELLDGWGIVREVIPPVIVLYVEEGKEEEAKRIMSELKEIEGRKNQAGGMGRW